MTRDYYRELEIPYATNHREIKRICNILTIELHTDFRQGMRLSPAEEKKWLALLEFKEIIRDPETWRAYDAELGLEPKNIDPGGESAGSRQPYHPPPTSKPGQPVHSPSPTGGVSPHRSSPPPPKSPTNVTWTPVPDYQEERAHTRRGGFLSTLLKGISAILIGLSTFLSGRIFNSSFVQHPGQGFSSVVGWIVGLVTGVLQVPPIGIFVAICCFVLGAAYLKDAAKH